MVFAIVFLQRLVLPVGPKGVTWLLPLAWAAAGLLLWRGLATISLVATAGVTAFVGAAFASQGLIGPTLPSGPSLSSLLLLSAIYPLCCLRIPIPHADWLRILGFFQGCLFAVAGLALVQMAVQLAGLPMPLLEHVLPSALLARDFNHVQEVAWSLGIHKPNGLVMLEASFLSQFLGIALVIELWFFRRTGPILLLSAALVMTFSGTGLGVVAVGTAVMVAMRGIDRVVLVLLLAAALGALGLVLTDQFETVANRLGEFSQGGSSADLRFVAPLQMLRDSTADPASLLLGQGAGFVDRMEGVAWNPVTKVWIEYGIVTVAAYLFFLATFVRGHGAPPLAAALLVEYQVFGGGALLQLPIVLICIYLAFGYAVVDSDEATCRPSRPVRGGARRVPWPRPGAVSPAL